MIRELKLKGKPYEAIVLRVISRFEDGTPEQLLFVKDDQTVELSEKLEENNFIVAYAPKSDYSQYKGQIPTL